MKDVSPRTATSVPTSFRRRIGLIVALDVPTADEALRAVEPLDKRHVLQNWSPAVHHRRLVAPAQQLRGKHIFVDLKIPGDIGNTIAAVIDFCVKTNVQLLTLSESMPPAGDHCRAPRPRPAPECDTEAADGTVPLESRRERFAARCQAGLMGRRCRDIYLRRAHAAWGRVRWCDCVGGCDCDFAVVPFRGRPSSSVQVFRPAGAATDDHKRFTTPLGCHAARRRLSCRWPAHPPGAGSSRCRLHASSREIDQAIKNVGGTWTFESNRRRRPTYRLSCADQRTRRIRELTQDVVRDRRGLHAALFGPRPFAEVVIGYVGTEPVGFALFFHNFSTFRGAPGIYLEDLFVEPQWRGQGFGRRLIAHLAAIAGARGCHRLEWAGPRLERSRDRLLPRAGRDADGRLVHLSSRWSRASRSRRGCLKSHPRFLCAPGQTALYTTGVEMKLRRLTLRRRSTRALLVLVVAASISVLRSGRRPRRAAGSRRGSAIRNSGNS